MGIVLRVMHMGKKDSEQSTRLVGQILGARPVVGEDLEPEVMVLGEQLRGGDL